MLKHAVEQRFGKQIADESTSEQLSIEVFLRTDHYISKATIMCLFGAVADGGTVNSKILSFLAEYAGFSPSEQI